MAALFWVVVKSIMAIRYKDIWIYLCFTNHEWWFILFFAILLFIGLYKDHGGISTILLRYWWIRQVCLIPFIFVAIPDVVFAWFKKLCFCYFIKKERIIDASNLNDKKIKKKLNTVRIISYDIVGDHIDTNECPFCLEEF